MKSLGLRSGLISLPFTCLIIIFQDAVTVLQVQLLHVPRFLGYEPYVIATTGDHGFVMIDGLYYDNMGPLFGASTHFAYSVRSSVKF